MPKIQLNRDELYPCYGFTEVGDHMATYPGSHIVNVSEKTLESWKKIMEDYGKLQKELKVAYELNS